MKNRFLWKTLCILLVFALLAGCEEHNVEVPEAPYFIDLYDPEFVGDEFALIGFSPNHESFQNAEGWELHWTKNDLGDRFPPPTGNMKAFLYSLQPGLTIDVYVATPYSKSFTVQTRVPNYGHDATFSAEFFRDGFYASDIEVYGCFEGTATLWDNNVVEIVGGNSSSFYVTFTVHEKTDSRFDIDSATYYYQLHGHGAAYTKISLVDDEIIAEGMVGKYTVTKNECGTQKVIYSKEYEGDTPPET